jgi:hypothetical protein
VLAVEIDTEGVQFDRPVSVGHVAVLDWMRMLNRKVLQ